MKNSKVWGIFNTLDESKLEEMEEFEIWEKIHSLNNDINLVLQHLENSHYKDISITALINEQFNLEYLIYYTRKFGVEFSKKPTFNVHIEQTESFNKWYNFWKNHFTSMDYNEYKCYLKDKKMSKDVSMYLPSTNWNDLNNSQEKSIQLQKVS